MENTEIKSRLETLNKQQEEILSKIKSAAEYYAKVVTSDDNKENHQGYYEDYTWEIHDELVRLANVTLVIKAYNDTSDKVAKKEESLFDWLDNNVEMGMEEAKSVEIAKYYADTLAKITPFVILRNMLSMKDVNVAVPVMNTEKFREDLQKSIRPLEEMIENRENRIELSEKLTIKIANILKPYND